MASGDRQRGPSRAEQFRPPRLGPPSSALSPRARELLDQIEEIFVGEGFARQTIDGLASRLKCSKGTLYDIAPSKDELVLVVLDRRLRRVGRALSEVLADLDDPAEKLDAYTRAEVRRPAHRTLKFSEDMQRHPAAARLFADHLRYSLLTLEEIVEEGIAASRFRKVHPRIVAEMIEATSTRLQDPNLLREAGLTYDEAINQLSDLVRGAVLAEAPSAPKRRRPTA